MHINGVLKCIVWTNKVRNFLSLDYQVFLDFIKRKNGNPQNCLCGYTVLILLLSAKLQKFPVCVSSLIGIPTFR